MLSAKSIWIVFHSTRRMPEAKRVNKMYHSKQLKLLYFKCKGSLHGFRSVERLTEHMPQHTVFLSPATSLTIILTEATTLWQSDWPQVTWGHPVTFMYRYDPWSHWSMSHTLSYSTMGTVLAVSQWLWSTCQRFNAYKELCVTYSLTLVVLLHMQWVSMPEMPIIWLLKR